MKGSEAEDHSGIEACRTCGIFFLTSSNFLRYLFSSDEPEMLHVRRELESWKVQLNESDGFPKYICSVCLLEFHRIFKFKNSCLETQLQLQQLYTLQQENLQKIRIKTETGEKITIEQKLPLNSAITADQTFIYVDDLSDDEYNNENGNITPFKIPHLPVKQEVIEEAHVPKTERSPEKPPDLSVLALTETEQPILSTQQEDSTVGIKCQLCLHISADQQQHRQHLLRIHETKPVECHICGKQFQPGTSETRLKYHMKWHRINKHIKCAQCGFHCASRDVLNEHMRAVHTKIPCKICGKHLFPKKMRVHIEKHRLTETSQRLQCPYCISDFTTNIEWNQHVLEFHAEEIRSNNLEEQSPFSSFDMQTDTVTNAQEITAPSKSETPEESFEASMSNTSANDISQNSNISNETSFKETEVQNSENTEIYYSDDNGSHENNDDEEELDDKNDDDSNNDLSNVRSLTDEMIFSCAQCPESFTRVEQLIAHSQTHAKPKPFKCDVCGKTFDLKFSLNRHLKKHKNTTL